MSPEISTRLPGQMIYIQLFPSPTINTSNANVQITSYIPVLVNFNNINPNNQSEEPPLMANTSESDPVDEFEELFDLSMHNNNNM